MYRMCVSFSAFLFLFVVSTVSAQGISNSYVELKNQYSGKCLSVKGGSTAHGAALMHKDCGTGGLDALWEMRTDGAGFRIVNKNSGLCLGVAHQSRKDGELVTQVSPCNRPDALWKVEYTSPGQPSGVDYGKPIVIRNNNSSKCLALVRGDEIKQYGCPPHRPQTTWQFAEASKPPTTYKRVFVTSETFLASFMETQYQYGYAQLAKADAICQRIAGSAGLPGTYRAWISGFDPASVVAGGKCEGMRMPERGLSGNSSTPYANICDGKPIKVADNFSDLVDGSLDNAIICTEHGTRFSGTPGVWTGTRTDGRTVHYDVCKQGKCPCDKKFPYTYKTRYDARCCEVDNCMDYTRAMDKYELLLQGGGSESHELRSLVGYAGAKDKNWTQYKWLSCDKKHRFRLYCFEQ